ncbi:MAG: ATP-dependent Clp protease proteolytic subunit [bacterium]|nr:ATP-dependent Clp protease proteolytic subunit [bacterium]
MENTKEELETLFNKELLEKRQLYLREVDSKSTLWILSSLTYLNAMSKNDPIELHITSTGGGARQGLDLCDKIRLSDAPVIGMVSGVANSIAAVVLQACHVRKIARNSIIGVHNASKDSTKLFMLDPDKENPYGIEDWEKIKESLAPGFEVQKEIIKIFSERTKREPIEIIHVLNKEKDFRSEEALEFGLVDEVI